jgi:hypothetical protein
MSAGRSLKNDKIIKILRIITCFFMILLTFRISRLWNAAELLVVSLIHYIHFPDIIYENVPGNDEGEGSLILCSKNPQSYLILPYNPPPDFCIQSGDRTDSIPVLLRFFW